MNNPVTKKSAKTEIIFPKFLNIIIVKNSSFFKIMFFILRK